jgi:hypothetical protein
VGGNVNHNANSGQTDADPWLRFSAAVRMAEYTDGDSSFERVFRRADTTMYEDKKQFKAQRGSYRVQS